jgi:zinc-binding in reverse transcriptase
LNSGGIINTHFQSIWNAYIPLKIKIFLWLVKQNRILTKDNLSRKCWQGDYNCIFCSDFEIINYLFIHCSLANCLWTWIARYNNFTFTCVSVQDLWQIDACISYKDNNICEMIREQSCGLYGQK